MVFFARCPPKTNAISKIKKAHATFYLEHYFSFAGFFLWRFFWWFGFLDSTGINIEKFANTIVIKICEPNIRDAINNYFFAKVHFILIRLLAQSGSLNKASMMRIELGSAAVKTTADRLPYSSRKLSKLNPTPNIVRLTALKRVKVLQSSVKPSSTKFTAFSSRAI